MQTISRDSYHPHGGCCVLPNGTADRFGPGPFVRQASESVVDGPPRLGAPQPDDDRPDVMSAHGVPIWDAHMHVHVLPGHRWDSPPERAIAVMDEAGIERAVIMPYSEIGISSAWLLDEGAQHARDFPGRFILFARLDPNEGGGAVDLLDHAHSDLGYVGLKLHPVGSRVHPTDPRTVALVKRAADLGMPTLFHCGDEDLTLPSDIGPLAEMVPEAQIIMGHAGGYLHVHQAVEWAQRCPNLHLEVSATPDLIELRHALDMIGPLRIIFGSDGPGCLPYLELLKVRLLLESFPAARDAVLSGNLRRLIGLEAGAA